MEPNAMPVGIYSNVQPGSMLGLEMSLHNPVPVQPQNPHQTLMNYHNHDENYHPQAHHPLSTKPKNQTLTLSDDDEPGFSADDGNKKVTSPWQRMKWTDNMVRLLIMVVFYIGDEVVSEAATDNSNSKKKGGGSASGGGALQRKGKWKSVSRAMMERGFYVSPQQCEDKFNDLNKRYKRVNDILGKGISCRVVENQSLLDDMDHISPKMKEEVKKLLNSKHLYFKEMCAYHNSCGHGSGGAADPPPPAAAAQPLQMCLHSENTNNHSTNVNVVPNLNRGENEETILLKGDVDADDDAEDEDDEHDDDDDDEDDDGDLNSSSRKRSKKGSSPSIQQLGFELTSVLQDGTKSAAEKRHWIRTKLVRLDEDRVGIQSRTLELEKQRLKWLKFSSKKEREMEKERLTNERLRLENERMVLVVRQKELDLLDQQQHSSNRKSGDPSSIT
ncbi:hypothetical protein CASFOL_013463 [Castilleja foliolosa]|uniref:Myb/SANT-like DNA-binding domain-containing protein n=1 Tax=Castilleja foliolosa TaxID=1961234 RepID=A0ABD3DKL7_9LAMI